MKVKFIKNHVLSFSDGRIIRYDEGTLDCLDNESAVSAINSGDAVEIVEAGNRFDFYKEKFSRPELQEICRMNMPEYMPSVHKKTADMIKLILDYERETEKLIKVEDNEQC